MTERRVPLRRCVGCGQMLPKPGLVRIVRPDGGACAIDPTGKAAGRGAYVCRKVDCVARAAKQRGFERSYKGAFPKDIYAALPREVTADEA
ncbi:MAG: YlxR family protein [Defluviitaleaceae bacterium]|nr:YlxR family protein [Defluviitaleaceae bacterium]